MKKDGPMIIPLHHVDLAINLILILLANMILENSLIIFSQSPLLSISV